MNKDTVDRLHEAIANAVKAMPQASPLEIARWVSKHHRSLIREFHDEWILAKLASLCRREQKTLIGQPMRRGRPTMANRLQLRLPGYEHFPHVPYDLQLEPRTVQKRGRHVLLPNATLADLKKRRVLVKGQFSEELPDLNRLIALMEPYDRAEPGIKVAEALKRQATQKGDRQA